MNVVAFTAMQTWRPRFEEENRLSFGLVEDAATVMVRRRATSIDDSIANMRLTTAVLDLASVYILIRTWMDGGMLNVERLQYIDQRPLLAPIGEDWFDNLCERVWARRKSASWIIRYACMEASRSGPISEARLQCRPEAPKG